MENLTAPETYDGLIISSHRVRDAKSKKAAQDSTYGWQPVSLTAEEWIQKLEEGRTIQPSLYVPKSPGKYTHAKKYWKGTHFICTDADHIKGVDFDTDGNDLNPDGLDPWTEDKQLCVLFPDLANDVYAASQSVNSMSNEKPPPHRRYRLTFLFDQMIMSEEHYLQVLKWLIDKYPIISREVRAPIQPVFGNAREGYNEAYIAGNILPLPPYVEPEPKPEPKPAKSPKPAKTGLGVREYLDKHGKKYEVATAKEAEYPQAVFVECPGKSKHTNPTARDATMVWQDPQKGYCFSCQHKSCGIEDWNDYRKAAKLPEPKQKKDATPQEEGDAYQGLPRIMVNDLDGEVRLTPNISDEAWDTLQKAGFESTRILERGGLLGTVQNNGVDGYGWESMKEGLLTGILSRHAVFMRYEKEKDEGEIFTVYRKLASPPNAVVKDLFCYQASSDARAFPNLKAIWESPFLFDGKIVKDIGYHEPSGIFRTGNADVKLTMPESSEQALQILTDLLSDFPFADDADRENALAIPLTLIVRPSFELTDMTPLFSVNASSPGTGKSELCKALIAIVTGTVASSQKLSQVEEEARKAMFAKLVSGSSYCVFDNIDERKPLDSAVLAGYVSEPRHSDRPMGLTEIVTVENRMLAIYNGNNIEAKFDLVDRGVLIQLESPKERAHERKFKHERLVQHIQENQGKYLGALIYMVQKWIDAGMPYSDHQHRMRHWARVVGGIMGANGFGKNLNGNAMKFRREADTESADWARAFGAIYDQFEGEEWSVSDIFDIGSFRNAYYDKGKHFPEVGDNLLGAYIQDRSRTDNGRKKSLGKLLTKRVGQTLGGYKLIKTGTLHRTIHYKLEKQEM